MSGPPLATGRPAPIVDRLRGNWLPVATRLRAVELRKAPWVDPRRWAILILIAVGMIAATALAFDNWALAWGDGLSPVARGFFQWVTRYGRSDWLLMPTGILVIVLAFGDWRQVDRRIAAAWGEVAGLAGAFFLVVAIPGLAIDIVKPIVGRWRPNFVEDGAFAFSPFSFGGYAHYSFPSGHATTVSAAAIFAIFALPRRWGIAVALAAAVVAVSRILVNAHHPSDVAGGVLAGLGIGYLVIRVLAEAGIGFAVGADRTVHPRVGVLDRLRRRREGGLAIMLPNLWIALSPGR
jgi:membrane-associated phospholipid phosphatase